MHADFLSQKLDDWAAERMLPFAADAVGAAVVLGRQEEVKDAAAFIMANRSEASTAALELASSIFEGSPQRARLDRIDPEQSRNNIRQNRALLRIDPRNAFAWAELARNYASVGLLQHAIKTMDVALALGPDNRYILRSASRLHIHAGDLTRAHHILCRAEATPDDPWLVAAEIATAGLAERSPKFIKVGERLIESSEFSRFDISELASAMATLESHAGNLKRARRLFRLSLEQPNDNALAQARWADTHKFIELNPAVLKVPSAFEARAWHTFYAGEWHETLKASKRWLRDQPFSASPAIHGSYIAAISLQNHEEAINITKYGLVANPNDLTLLNNQSYSLACLGRTEEAATVFGRIDRRLLTPENNAVLAATAGLILYRQGDTKAGRAMYERAMEIATGASQKRLAAKASLFLAFEELRTSSSNAVSAAQRALDLSAVYPDADLHLLRERLRSALDRMLQVTQNPAAQT